MNKFKEIFGKDYFRNTGGKKYNFFVFFILSPKMKQLYWIRRAQTARFKLFNIISRILSNRYMYKTGNEISWKTKIGYGLYLGHIGPRYINSKAIIGNNVNINQNVTIGQLNRGKKIGTPTISDNVWIGAGSVIVGDILIGKNVMIAPNSFVNFDVPDDSIVVGYRCSVVQNTHATEGYINNLNT